MNTVSVSTLLDTARGLGMRETSEMLLFHSLSAALGTLTYGHATTGPIALHDAGPTLADGIRWSGIIVACAGALVAAPGGVARIRDGIMDTAWKLWRRLLGQLARVLPWLGKDANVPPATARGSVRIPTPRISGRGWVWNENDPDAQKIDALRRQILELWEELSRAQQQARAGTEALRTELMRDLAALRADHHAVIQQHEQEKRQDAQIDARGLPLVALGIVLTGVPDGLAARPWIGWPATAVALLLTIWLAAWPCAVWLAHKIARPAGGRTAAGASGQPG